MKMVFLPLYIAISSKPIMLFKIVLNLVFTIGGNNPSRFQPPSYNCLVVGAFQRVKQEHQLLTKLLTTLFVEQPWLHQDINNFWNASCLDLELHL